MPSRAKVLGMPRRLESLHAIFALPCGTMGVLTAAIEIATLPVFHPGQDLALRCAIALQLVRDDHPWHVLQALEQLAKELLGGLLIPPTLDQDVEHIVVLVDSTPQVMAFAIDREKHLIKMPLVPWLGAATLQPIRVILPKLETLLADGFMGDVDPACKQEFLHVAVAQGEVITQPDPMADDLAGKAVVFVACSLSRRAYVWLPILGYYGS